MKSNLLAISFGILLFISSCLPKNSRQDNFNDSKVIPQFQGQAYLQPLDKIISLSFASGKTTVFINFVDSVYCNISINSAVGNIVQNRKYVIDSTRVLTLLNPLSDKKTKFKLLINPDTTIVFKNMDGVDVFKMVPVSEVDLALLSQNELKKQEFLYPTLTEKEREFGAENQYIQANDGRLISKPHPLKKEVNKINIYKLF